MLPIVAIPYALGSLVAIGIGAAAMPHTPVLGLILASIGTREIFNLVRLGPKDTADGWRPDDDGGDPDEPTDQPSSPSGRSILTYRTPSLDGAARWRCIRRSRRPVRS